MTAFKDWLNSLTSKSTPADADELYLRDSSGTPSSKKLTWANLKAMLQTITDTVSAVGGSSAGSALTVNQTFNTTGTPTALKVNVTDTASNAASLLADFQVGGTSKVSIDKAGNIKLQGGDYDVYRIGSNGLYSGVQLGVNNGVQLTVVNTRVSSNGVPIVAGWGGYFVIDATNDMTDSVKLYRDAANTLAQRNGTNAQTYRHYGTYTDASNYRRVALAMTTAGVATLAPEGAGTGASGNVLHISGLPTSNPGAGILWNDTGTVKVGT